MKNFWFSTGVRRMQQCVFLGGLIFLFNSQALVEGADYSSSPATAMTTESVYAILGQPALLSCSGYERIKLNATGNVSDVYSLRWFKNQRSTDYILFTYLDLPPHRITMPQNEWKDRNVTFAMRSDQNGLLSVPQIRLPNITFRDEAKYICDLTPAAASKAVVSAVELKVVACPDVVDLTIINSTDTSAGVPLNNTTSSPLTLPATQSFFRGTRVLVRCSTVSFPEAMLTMSIPGISSARLEQPNLSESPENRGYMRRTLEGYFTLDGPDDALRVHTPFTIDCKATVANATCENTSSMALLIVVPTTKALRSSATQLNIPDGSVPATNVLTGGQIAGIVVGCIVLVAMIAIIIYMAIRHSNKELCTKPRDYKVNGVNGGGGRKPNKKEISHPRAISAYPQAPCPKTGSVSFVDASALL